MPENQRAGEVEFDSGVHVCNGDPWACWYWCPVNDRPENPANTVSRILCDQDFRADRLGKSPGQGACGPEGSESHLVE